MIQNQLIDYISSQLKLGISKDVIKTSLVGAGWPMADIDETMQHLDSGGGKTAQPVVAASVAAVSAKPAVAAASKMQDPQTIRMSDLISTSDSAKSFAGFPDAKATKEPAKEIKIEKSAASPIAGPAMQPVTAKPVAAAAMPMEAMTMTAKPAGKSGLIMKIVSIALIVIFAGLSGFLFFQNNNLMTKLSALNMQSAKVTADLAAIKTSMNSSSTGMSEQVADLTAQNADLLLNLSFYAIPPAAPIAPSKVLLAGAISGGGKTPFVVTTKYGAKITVQNSKDAKVVAWLTPFVGTSTVVSGTYAPGTPAMTAVPPEAPAAVPVIATTTTGTTTITTTSTATTTGTAK